MCVLQQHMCQLAVGEESEKTQLVLEKKELKPFQMFIIEKY